MGTDTQQPDAAPGPYYVSVVDGSRFALLSGPYPDHQAALDAVDTCRKLSERHDARAFWYSYGTCRVKSDHDAPGLLQRKLGYPLVTKECDMVTS